MSVIVANSSGGGGGGGGSSLSLYDENPIAPSAPNARGDDSIAIGSGAQTSTSALNSVAIGNQSLARHRGAVVIANGMFNEPGDVQHGKYILRTITTTDVAVEAFLDGTNGTERLTLPDNSTWTFTITITAHRSDGQDGHAGYKVEGVIYRTSGANTTAVLGNMIKMASKSNPTWDINISADQTNGSLKVMVIGEAGKTILWVALVETLEINHVDTP